MNKARKLVFFDTETTGNTEKDYLVQLAYKYESDNAAETFEGLYRPSIKIPPEASAVHHITNKMVADKPSFQESEEYTHIKELFEDEDTVVIAHNACFDLSVIKKEDIVPKNFICTLRVIRHMDSEESIGRYNLQYLRYLLELEIEAKAHDAMGDVLVLEVLFNKLKNDLMEEEGLSEEEAIDRMIEISSRPSLIRSFKFGKYNGQKLEIVIQTDKGYLEWLLAEKKKGDVIDEDWIYTLEHYLKLTTDE